MSNHDQTELTVEQAEFLLAELNNVSNKLMLYKPFVSYFGGLDIAMVLSEIFLWSQISRHKYPDRNGWFYRSYDEWKERIGLNEYRIRKLSRQLEGAEYIETKVAKAYGNPTCHYRSVLGKILNLMVSLNFKETNLNNVRKRFLKNERNDTSNFKESLTDYTTDITSNTTTSLPHERGGSSTYSHNSKPNKRKKNSVETLVRIDNDLIQRMTINTPFSGLSQEFLAYAIHEFGADNVLTAIDIASWKRVSPKKSPEQYISGMCTKGLVIPSGYRPFAVREADDIARQHHILAEEEAKARKVNEDAEKARLQEEQEEDTYKALPLEIRARAEEEVERQYPDNATLRNWWRRVIAKQIIREGGTAVNQESRSDKMDREERLNLLRKQATLIL